MQEEQEEQAKQLKAAKEKAAADVKKLLKPLLGKGSLDREQFKAVARAATGALYRKLQWTQNEACREVQAALLPMGIQLISAGSGDS